MIGPPTVLIVGAGASVPYELPSARRALEDAITGARELTRELPRVTALSADEVRAFLDRLRTAECDSIDAVLERHALDEHIQRAGRAVIAYTMAPYLRRTTLTAPDADWVKFVWNHMADGAATFADLRRNRLHFVTFNVDRVIELKLTKAIEALYGTARAEDVREFVEAIVLHVQGAIPHPAPHSAVTSDWMTSAMRGLRTVREPASDLTLNIAQNLLQSAHVIACLGFGHHRDNVAKLGFPTLTPALARAKTIYSTAVSLREGQIPEMQRAYGAGWQLELGKRDESCLEFLQNRDILQG